MNKELVLIGTLNTVQNCFRLGVASKVNKYPNFFPVPDKRFHCYFIHYIVILLFDRAFLYETDGQTIRRVAASSFLNQFFSRELDPMTSYVFEY